MSYENETCEGCVCYEGEREGIECHHHEKSVGPWSVACEHLKPSIQCRQVRALEQLADCVSYSEGGRAELDVRRWSP